MQFLSVIWCFVLGFVIVCGFSCYVLRFRAFKRVYFVISLKWFDSVSLKSLHSGQIRAKVFRFVKSEETFMLLTM